MGFQAVRRTFFIQASLSVELILAYGTHPIPRDPIRDSAPPSHSGLHSFNRIPPITLDTTYQTGSIISHRTPPFPRETTYLSRPPSPLTISSHTAPHRTHRIQPIPLDPPYPTRPHLFLQDPTELARYIYPQALQKSINPKVAHNRKTKKFKYYIYIGYMTLFCR